MITRMHRLALGFSVLVVCGATLVAPAWPAPVARPLPPVKQAPSKVAAVSHNVGVTVQVISTPLPSYGTWLAQNFPTCFAYSTTIRYSLARSSRVSMVVYNVTGQKAATLVNWVQGPGIYSLQWNGRGDDGRPLPSGVYLYQLIAANRSMSKKMILIR